MKIFILLLSFLLAQQMLGQNIDFKKIQYNGLNFYSTKNQIIQKLGRAKKIYNPNYECGFLSDEEQNDKYLTLDYGKIKFTGNSKEKYLLEMIDFKDETVVVFYGKIKLNSQSTDAQLSKIFGMKIKANGSRLIPSNNGDDGVRIELKKGKLTKIEYWSPC